MDRLSVPPLPLIDGQLEAIHHSLPSDAPEPPSGTSTRSSLKTLHSIDDCTFQSSLASSDTNSVQQLGCTPVNNPLPPSLKNNGKYPPGSRSDLCDIKNTSKPVHIPKSHLTAVFFSGLNADFSAGSLSHKLSGLPGFLSVHMPMRNARISRGFAVAHFKDMDSAMAAMEASRKQKFYKTAMKMRLSPPISAELVRKFEQDVKGNGKNNFSRSDGAAMSDDRKLKQLLIQGDNDRAKWEPGYAALSEKLTIRSDMGNFCELLNKELRNLEFEYARDTVARRNFRVWEKQFKLIAKLSKVLTDGKSCFLNFKDFKPSENDDESKSKARDEVLTAMHRLAERASNITTFIEAFRDINYGPNAKYESSFGWKLRKARQEIVHDFFGALEGSMRWEFIHEVYLEAIPLVLNDISTFEKLVRRRYTEIFSKYGEFCDGESGEADMDLETSDDE